MELIMVRHGLPEQVATQDGSPADPPLSAEGRAQAEKLSRWLAAERIDAVYASPMRRALQTAAPLTRTLQLEVTLEPGVVEFDQHADSYVPVEELKRTDPERFRALVESDWDGYLEADSFRERVVGAMQRIIADHPGGRVAVFCHAGVINFWGAHVLGISRPMFFYPRYTSINRFMASRDGRLGVASLNELGHLR